MSYEDMHEFLKIKMEGTEPDLSGVTNQAIIRADTLEAENERLKAQLKKECACGDIIELNGKRNYTFINGNYYCTDCALLRKTEEINQIIADTKRASANALCKHCMKYSPEYRENGNCREDLKCRIIDVIMDSSPEES